MISWQVGKRKPEEEVFRYTLEKLGVSAEEAVFVDDKEENIAAARRLGLKTVLARSPEQVVREVSQILGEFDRKGGGKVK